jgi:Thioredoxin
LSVLRNLLFLGAVLAFPYTIYSIYYQGVIVKQWCILCLSIQLMLTLEFSLAIVHWYNSAWIVSTQVIPIISLAYLLPMIIWFGLKPILTKSLNYKDLDFRLTRFKSQPNIFSHLFQQEPMMPPLLNEMAWLEIGEPFAQNTITLVSDPYCEACAKVHQQMEDMIKQNPNLKCQIILTATNQPNDKRGEFVRYLHSINSNEQNEALSEWFKLENKANNLSQWQKKYKPQNEPSDIQQKIEYTAYWLHQAQINSTPTIYFNQHRLPDMYQVADLQYLSKYLNQKEYA